jgi:hypothetical protein
MLVFFLVALARLASSAEVVGGTEGGGEAVGGVVGGTEGGEVPGVEELGRAPAGPVPSEVATPPPSAEEVSRVTRAVNISLKSAFV